MAIPPELLDMLVCPVDKAKVELLPGESGLKCTECKRVYPIREDIPVMLPEEATLDAKAENSAEKDTPQSA